MYDDKHRVERHFEVGGMVYLCLQPYKQYSLKQEGEEKLRPQFYGLYKVVRMVVEVAYKLYIHLESPIHNVFHVSCLKNELEQRVTTKTKLPPLDDERKIVLTLEFILATQERRLRNGMIKEHLV